MEANERRRIQKKGERLHSNATSASSTITALFFLYTRLTIAVAGLEEKHTAAVQDERHRKCKGNKNDYIYRILPRLALGFVNLPTCSYIVFQYKTRRKRELNASIRLFNIYLALWAPSARCVCVCVFIIFLNHSFETLESMCLQKWRTKKWNKEETTPNYGRLSSSSFITANRDRKLATNKQKGNI